MAHALSHKSVTRSVLLALVLMHSSRSIYSVILKKGMSLEAYKIEVILSNPACERSLTVSSFIVLSDDYSAIAGFLSNNE